VRWGKWGGQNGIKKGVFSLEITTRGKGGKGGKVITQNNLL